MSDDERAALNEAGDVILDFISINKDLMNRPEGAPIYRRAHAAMQRCFMLASAKRATVASPPDHTIG